jgi:hypothetical protein
MELYVRKIQVLIESVSKGTKIFNSDDGFTIEFDF